MSQILGAGTVAPDFKLRVTPDQWLSLGDLRGQTGHPGLLPRRLESGLRRSDGALQRDPCPSSASTAPSSWASRWTEPGATRPSPRIATCTSRCWRTSIPRGRWRRAMAPIGKAEGVSERALFVLDSEGVIFWSYCSPIAVNPGADGILDALERMPNARKTGHGHAQSSSHAA